MNILSQDGNTLVNYDNVSSLYIQEVYRQYAYPDRWWEIRALYPAVSEDAMYDIIAKFNDKKKCEAAFKKAIHEICELKLDFIKI